MTIFFCPQFDLDHSNSFTLLSINSLLQSAQVMKVVTEYDVMCFVAIYLRGILPQWEYAHICFLKKEYVRIQN